MPNTQQEGTCLNYSKSAGELAIQEKGLQDTQTAKTMQQLKNSHGYGAPAIMAECA
jgi:hypothetical protein